MGRMKYLNPIYTALVQSGKNSTAVQWNNENVDFYSKTAEKGVLDIIYPTTGETAKIERRSRRFYE